MSGTTSSTSVTRPSLPGIMQPVARQVRLVCSCCDMVFSVQHVLSVFPLAHCNCKCNWERLPSMLLMLKLSRGHATSTSCVSMQLRPHVQPSPGLKSLLPHLLLLPQPDQLQHEHILVTLQGVNLISHATIVTKLQHDTRGTQSVNTHRHKRSAVTSATQSNRLMTQMLAWPTCSWLDETAEAP